MNYIKKLMAFSLIIAVFASVISVFPFMKSLQTFIWCSIGFFTISSAIIFFILKSGIRQKNNYSFISSVYLAMFAKMILCVGLVLAYFFMTKPGNIYFIIPFFVLYICYTVFETYFLVKESKLPIKN